MKAFVMAGGIGKRFRPYSKRIPKPLAKVGGETLLKRNILQIKRSFPDAEINVVVSQCLDQFRAEISEISEMSEPINIITLEPELVRHGLIAGFAAVLPQLNSDELYISVLGDEFYGGNDHRAFAAFIDGHGDADICCAIKETMFPQEYLVNYAVLLEQNSKKIERVVEKPATIISDHFGLGLIAFRRQLAELASDVLQKGREGNLINLINEVIAGGGRAYGVEFKDIYVNINNRSDYYAAITRYRTHQWREFSVDVIIPAWEECDTIEYVVRDAIPFCNKVIVVDNVSKDGTAKLAQAAGAHVISEPTRGYGDALRKGIDASTADIIVLTEADGTFRGEDIEKLLTFLKNSDAVLGTRTYLQYVEVGANMSFIQRAANISYGWIITLLWWNRKTRFTDVGCTFRALWRSSYQKIRPRLVEDGPALSPEMMIELLNDWHRVIEIPIPYHPRMLGESKFSRSFLRLALTALSMLRLIVSRRLWSWLENLRFLMTRNKN